MLPTLPIGSWQVSSYTLAYVAAALVTDLLCLARLRRLGLPLLAVLRAVLVVTVSGFAGAYLIRVVPTLQHLAHTGSWHWIGGTSFVGGLLSGIGALALLCRFYRVPLVGALDRVLPAVAIGQAIGRLGCLAAGCCYGRPTASWAGLYLPDHAGHWAVRYPTQLLSAAAYLLTGLVLLRLDTRTRPPGFVALLYLGLYCLERFLAEFLRADALPAWGPASWAQIYTLSGMILVAVLLGRQRRLGRGSRHSRRKEVPGPPDLSSRSAHF